MQATKWAILRAFLAAAALLCVHSARADEPARVGRTSSLAWVRLTGAESCIAAPALAMAVEKKLGRRVFVPPSDAEITVEGTIEWRAEPKRARATFRVSDRAGKVLGSRSVDEPATSCEKLDDRLAFVVALLIDPEAAMGGDAEPAAPAPDPSLTTPLPPPPAPTPPPVDAHVAAPASEEAPPPWRWMLGAEFGGAAGLVPDVGWVVSGSLLVTPPRWPGIRAKGSSFLPTSRRVEGVALAEIGLVSGELGICPLEWRPAPFGITLCASGLLGQLDARGQGFPESRGYSTTLGGLAIDAVLELHFTKAVGLTLSPALVVPLSRARLAYEDSAGVRRTIFDMSAVGGSLAIGLSVGSR